MTEVSLPVSGVSDEELKRVINRVASSLGFNLKMQQEESLFHFAKGKDVFVSLPTGFGKSLCYILLPPVFDFLRGVDKESIILVVSPLISLMEDQVSSIQSMGLSAAYISESTSRTMKQQIHNGKYQVVLISPEALFCATERKQMLSTNYYRLNLVAMVVDEAHCVKKW